MIRPLQITFRNMQPSAAVAARVRAEAAKLDRYCTRITSCRVIIEAPHRHHKWGESFHVSINIDVPRSEIVVRHEPKQRRAIAQSGATKWVKHFEVHGPSKDIYVTIRDAFGAARRQLEDYARRMRGDVKIHARTPPPRMAKILT